jgi:hypothetical protein
MKIREVACNPEESNAELEDVNMILTAIEENLSYWRHEDENELEILGVEIPFDYILHEDDYIRIIISGKIDLLANVRGIGNRTSYNKLPFDHKSLKREFPVLRLSNQFQNYCVATESNYLIVNRIGLQKSKTAEERFKRIPVSYDPLILQQWKDNTIRCIIDHYLTCVGSDHWPMNPNACYAFGRLCEFYEVCDSSGLEAKLYKLEANYVEGKPWDKYDKGE